MQPTGFPGRLAVGAGGGERDDDSACATAWGTVMPFAESERRESGFGALLWLGVGPGAGGACRHLSWCFVLEAPRN